MEGSPPGVIDTLQAGFNTVARRAWTLAIPVALDIYLWLGPRLSIAGLARRLVEEMQVPAEVDPAVKEYLGAAREVLEKLGREANLFAFLRQGILGVPGLMESAGPGRASPTMELDSLLALGLAGVLLTLLGLLLGSLYLDLLTGQVGREGPLFSARRWLVLWGRMVLLMAMLLALLTAFAVLQGLSITLAGLVNPFLGVLFTFFWLGAMGLGMVGLFLAMFTVEAAFLNQVGILAALRNSYQVVRRNFWASLWFLMLVRLIGWGMSIIWRRIAGGALGTLMGIAGNAFIGTGLVAAGLIFYRDRYRSSPAREG